MPFYIFINSIKVINFWNLCENILGFTRKATAVNLFKEVQITVDSVYPVIHCGCFVVPDKIVLKAEQMIDCQVIVQGMIKSVGSQAAANRIRRGLGFFQIGMKGRFIYFLHICFHAEHTFHSITSLQSDLQ